MDIIVKKTGRFVGILFIVFILNFGVLFSEISVSAKISDERIGINEPFTITVTIEGGAGNVVFRNLPDGFKLRSTSQSRDIRIINFTTVSSQTFYYTYTASEEGIFTIKSIEARVKNTIYNANSISIEVVRDSVRVPKRSQNDTLTVNDDDLTSMFRDDAYIKNSISKKEAYINESIYIQQTLFTRIPLRILGVSSTPKRSDFYSIINSNEYQQTREVINSSDFNVKILREEAIYALKPGQKKIDTASFVFQNTASIFAEQLEKGSDNLTINILPLPPVKQGVNFSGAVGEFNVRVEASHSNIGISDTVILRIIVDGDGNTSVITMPKINDNYITNMFSLYPPKTYENYGFSNGVLYTKKIDEYVLVAREAGTFELDKILFSYFSPKDKTYKTIESESLSINVSEVGISGTTYNNNANDENNKHLTIRNAGLNIVAKHDVFRDIYVRIYVITLLLITAIVLVVILLKKEKIEKKEGLKKVDDLFINAKKYYENNERLSYVKEIYSVFSNLLAKNLKLSENSTIAIFVDSLYSHNINSDTVKEIEAILKRCNYEIYGGFAYNKERDYHSRIIKILEDLKWVYKT